MIANPTVPRPRWLPRQPGPVSASTPTAPASPWELGAAQLDRSTLVFLGFLLTVVMLYSGLPEEISLLRSTKTPTLVAYSVFLLVAIRADVLSLFEEKEFKILIAFIAWTVLSALWAVVTMTAVDAIRPFIDYITFAVITVFAIDRRKRLDRLAIVISLLIVYLFVQNQAKFGSERSGTFSAPYFMGDGNDFAWGINVLFPLTVWLVIGRGRSLWVRGIGLAGVAACFLSVIGTSSRGGTFGMVAALLYLWWFGARRRWVGTVAMVIVVIGVLFVAPSSYFNRLGTTVEFEQDNSAQSRLQAWSASIKMARDYPLGVGARNFNSAYGRWYNPSNGGEGTARIGWNALRWMSPHSIYFGVLGEYGFGGLTLLAVLLASLIVTNHRTRLWLKRAPEGAPFDDRWPALINMSVIGFAVSGAFLGGFHYPHLFFITALTLSAKRIVQIEARSEAVVAPATAGGPILSVRAAKAERPVVSRSIVPLRRA
jgi:probable O-glycosylation ligase (exosortase A-associated)